MKLEDIESLGSQRKIPNVTIEDRSIGRILIDMGRLKTKDVARVFALHRENDLRFGEAARKLRLVKDEDVQHALSIQFNYPYLKSGQAVLGPELVAAHDPFGVQAETIRDLRTQLMVQWIGAERKVLAIVSPGTGDGRSHLAANLAVVFAQLGEKTLLIDADMRHPRQQRIFGLANGLGLAHVLSRRAGIESAELVSYFESLSVLAAGAIPPNPLELLSRPELEHLLVAARKHYSVVLIDTPANSNGSDARLISARADGVLIVVRQDHTRLSDLERLRRAVAGFNGQVIGTVLTNH
jgi:receptor protein-tyrosine kinase